MATLYRDMLDRLGDASLAFGRRVVGSRAPLRQRQQHRHLRAGPHLRAHRPRQRQRHQPPGRVAELLRRSWGSRCSCGRGFNDRDSDSGPESRDHQRGGGAASTSRTRIRSGSGWDQHRKRPAISRSSASSATSSTTACAMRRRRRCSCRTCRRGSATRSSRCARRPYRRAVTGAVREAVRQIDPNLPVMDVSTQIEQVELRFMQEKVLRAGLHALRGAGAAAGRDRPLRLDVLQRGAPDERDRHPHGARRAAAGRSAPRHARVDDPRHHRRRRWPRDRASAPAGSSPRCSTACHRPTSLRSSLAIGVMIARIRRRRLHPGASCVASRSDGRAALRVIARITADGTQGHGV